MVEPGFIMDDADRMRVMALSSRYADAGGDFSPLSSRYADA